MSSGIILHTPKHIEHRDHASQKMPALMPQLTSIKLTDLLQAANKATSTAASKTPTAKAIALTNLLRPPSKAATTAFFGHLHVSTTHVDSQVASPITPCKHRRLLDQGVKTTNDPIADPANARKPKAMAPSSQPAAAALMSKWQNESKPSSRDTAKHSALIQYNQQYRGLNTANHKPMNGKHTPFFGFSTLYKTFSTTVTMSTGKVSLWKQALPTRLALHNRARFGSPSKNHSFTQEGCFETCIFPILVSGYLDFYDFSCLCSTHGLIPHLVSMIIRCHPYDFTWIAYEDPFWKQQTTVPQSHACIMLAALFHF